MSLLKFMKNVINFWDDFVDILTELITQLFAALTGQSQPDEHDEGRFFIIKKYFAAFIWLIWLANAYFTFKLNM